MDMFDILFFVVLLGTMFCFICLGRRNKEEYEETTVNLNLRSLSWGMVFFIWGYCFVGVVLDRPKVLMDGFNYIATSFLTVFSLDLYVTVKYHYLERKAKKLAGEM